ncbi:MAG: hypothetical protein EOO66_32095, partial [Methylobacterium sp.]
MYATGIGVHRHDGPGDLGPLAQAVLVAARIRRLDVDDVAGIERREASGQVSKDRETGTITAEGTRWTGRSPAAALNAGDV